MVFPHQKTTRSAMKPTPMRMTPQQFEKLAALRAQDGLTVQEHIRRAIDVYLALAETGRLPKGIAVPSPPPPLPKHGGSLPPAAASHAAPAAGIDDPHAVVKPPPLPKHGRPRPAKRQQAHPTRAAAAAKRHGLPSAKKRGAIRK